MEITAPVKEKTHLPNPIKSFLIGWSLIIVLAWFGSLWFVTGLLGLRQDDQGWQVYNLLLAIFVLFIRPLYLFLWLRRKGFKHFPVYLPARVLNFLVTAIMVESLMIVVIGQLFFDAYDLSQSSHFVYLSTIALALIFQLDKRSPQKLIPWTFVWIGLFVFFVFLGFSGIDLREEFEQIALILPFPLSILAIWGFLGSTIATVIFSFGLTEWMSTPDWRVQKKKIRSLSDRLGWWAAGIIAIGAAVFLAAYSPSSNAILNGLQPCGWIDQRLGRSACVERWQTHGTDQGLLSSSGERFIEYDSKNSALRIWSSQGELLNEFLLGSLPSGYGLDAIDYLEEKDALAFSVLERGVFVRGSDFGGLITLPSRSSFYILEDMRLSPDGEFLVVFPGNGITVWRIEDQQEVAHLEAILLELEDVHFDANSSKIRMLFNDGVTASWDYATEELTQVGDKIEYIEGVFKTAFIAENEISYIVTAKDNELLLWPSEGEVVHLLDDASLNVNLTEASIVVSPDGRTLLASGYDWMQVWRVSDGASLLVTKTCLYSWDCSGVFNASLSNTGLIALYHRNEIQIWSLITEIE